MGFGFIVARFGMFIRETGTVVDGIARGLFSMSTGATLILIGVLIDVRLYRHQVVEPKLMYPAFVRPFAPGRDTARDSCRQ